VEAYKVIDYTDEIKILRVYDAKGILIREEYSKEGARSKDNSVYIEPYHLDTREWFTKNRRHRDDGPAEICYFENGDIFRKSWYKDDLLHNQAGPAYIRYSDDGRVSMKYYVLWGTDVSFHDFRMYCLITGNMEGLASTYETTK